MSTSPVIYLEEKLLEYPASRIRDSHAEGFADQVLDDGQGFARLAPRFSGRPFMFPHQWTVDRLDPSALQPSVLAQVLGRPFTFSEWWLTNQRKIPTGAILRATGQAPLMDGVAMIANGDGSELMPLQRVIAARPDEMLGPDVAAKSMVIYGEHKCLVTIKRFTTKTALPGHTHPEGANRKPEIHLPRWVDNPEMNESHSQAQAIALATEMTRDDFLRCMREWEKNEIRHWFRWYLWHLGLGAYLCPPGLFHKPNKGTTIEFHCDEDNHLVYQHRMPDCALTMEEAMGAAPAGVFPSDAEKSNPEFVTSTVDFGLNQQPDSVIKGNLRRKVPAEEYCGTGIRAFWEIHGPMDPKLPTSALSLEMDPKARITLSGLPSAGAFFLSRGAAKVGTLDCRFVKGIKFDGTISPEAGWFGRQAVADGITVENTGDDVVDVVFGFQAEKILS